MKAIQAHEFGKADVLKLELVDNPTVTAAVKVIVEIKAVGVNPADTYMRGGAYAIICGAYAIIPNLPYTPGGDVAGVVAAVGTGVTLW